MIDVTAVVESAQQLEPLPQSIVRLANLVICPEVDFDEVEEVVSLDQGLTVRLLKAANSVAGGARTEVGTMKMAISRLGTGNILSLAISSCVQAEMSCAIPSYDFGPGALWNHSVVAALCSEEIRKISSKPVPAECFTVALLHDVGKMVLGRYLTDECVSALKTAREEQKLRTVDAEKKLFTVHHGEIGGHMARQWGLPDSIVRGIHYHHHPDAVDDLNCAVVSVADSIARWIGISPDPEKLELGNEPDEVEGSRERLGLSTPDYESIGKGIAARFEEISRKYS